MILGHTRWKQIMTKREKRYIWSYKVEADYDQEEKITCMVIKSESRL